MNRLPHIILALTLALTLIGTACNDDSCFENGSSLPLAQCYMDDEQVTISGLTIMGIGAPGDSLLVDSSAIKEVYLPLRASVNSTSFVLKRWGILDIEKVEFLDTLTIDYEAIEFFHSAECGAMYNFNIKRVTYTDNAIDSVTLLTTLITNAIAPSLRIHFTNLSQR